MLCCVRPRDVFPPHQPVLDCGMYRNWFGIKAALTTGVVIAGGFIGGFLMLTTSHSSIEDMRNVRIVSRFDDYNFRASVQDHVTGAWSEFGLRFCPSYHPSPEIITGVTLTNLKYRTDQLHACADISDNEFGYIILRGEHNEPVIADAR